MDKHQREPGRRFGTRDGLEQRLAEHIERMGTDRRLPWVGLGLIDDLRAAIDALQGAPECWDTPKKSPPVYDL